jgi:hypothetical protein
MPFLIPSHSKIKSMEWNAFGVAERLMRYVQIDTQSDPNSVGFPSTEKQKDLSKLLLQELLDIGLVDANMDANGYVMATIPATIEHRKISSIKIACDLFLCTCGYSTRLQWHRCKTNFASTI